MTEMMTPQGMGTPALQGPLTSPDDDYTTGPPMILLALPRELVEQILLLLDTKSMLKCRFVNREFNAIIQSSTLVQYYLACDAAGVIDNPRSPLSYVERFEALKKREDAWRKLEPVFEMTMDPIDHFPPSHELTAGYYFVNAKDLYCCHLPSFSEDNPQWFKIPRHGPGQNRSGSICTAVYEHNLLVIVLFSEVGDQADMQQHSVDLVLLKFSTGEYHPLAHHPLIHVQRSPSAQTYTSVKIVGDHLALLVHVNVDKGCSELFIFDWKTGHKRLQHKAIGSAYQCSVPVFISPELLFVPNRILSHFEVWRIPSNPNYQSPTQILSLQIPAVSDNYFITNIYGHGEPSPFLHSMSYFPPRPFFPSSENSIITINFRFDSFYRSPKKYKLVMRRRALLDTIHKWTSPSPSEQERPSTWFTNEFVVHKAADPDDGSVRLAAQSKLVSTVPESGSSPQARNSSTLTTSQISPTSPGLRISAGSSYSPTSSGSAPSTSLYHILQVQWGDWGSPISRWFRLNAKLLAMPQSNGQRCVFWDPNPHDKKKGNVSVADFNPYNVRKNAEMMVQLRRREGGGKSGKSGSNEEGKKEENEEELELLDRGGVFSEEVYMGLKCVVYHAPGEYEFDAVMMDEERLLGFKFDYVNKTDNIKVLYFG